MSGIKIPVEAQFDKGDVTQALQQFTAEFNKLGATIAQANKLKFSPISKATLEDMKRLQAGMESLRKVSGDFNKRINATGQKGAGFFQLDWSKMYPDQHSRNRQMQKAFEYVTGTTFGAMPAALGGGAKPPSGGGGGGGGGAAGGGQGRRIVSAGLNAIGPVGGVANSALSAGMSGGIGAGLAGLGGGLAALFIGKAVGAVVEKVGAVEAENIRHDRIKRQLGDTGVGFQALKASIRGAAGQMGVTFDEGQDLAAQYIKTAGLSNRNWRGIGEEVATAGNFARSFGVDQSQAVGAFGTLRMMGVTGNDQQARRMALLIGEGIAKSDAFSKADEVLEAIAGFTSSQTRAGMNRANVEGYTSMLAGMAGAKLPGMDVASSAALLSRMNASISGGGSAGEAGQNFLYSALGGRGMDPMDVAVLREQGLFGTGRGTFGAGSTYARYASKYGLGTPDAANDDSTNFERIQRQFEKAYGGGPQARKLMANAMSNLYGINNSQAMAIATVDPAQLGGMGRRLDRLGINVKGVNATGISRMAQIEGDSSLSQAEKDKQMRQAARDGQEQTQGSIAKDSKAALENIKSSLADRLVPAAEAMRNGIMFLAGGKGAMSTRQIQEAMMSADSDDRRGQIKAEFEKKIAEEAGKPGSIRAQRDAALAQLRGDYADPEKRAAGQARVQALSDQLAKQEDDTRKRVLQLQQEREAAIKKETEGLAANIRALAEEEAARRKRVEQVADGSAGNAAQAAFAAGAGAGRGFVNPDIATYLAETDRLIGAKPGTSAAQIQQESGFNPTARSRAGAMGLAQVMPSTLRSLEKRFGRKLDPDNPADAVLMHRELMRENTAKFGNVPDALRAYNGGWDRSKWGNAETANYVPAIEGRRERMAGSLIPDTGTAERPGEQRVVVEVAPGEFVLKDQRGQQLAQTQVQATGRVARPQPAGM